MPSVNLKEASISVLMPSATDAIPTNASNDLPPMASNADAPVSPALANDDVVVDTSPRSSAVFSAASACAVTSSAPLNTPEAPGVVTAALSA